MAFLRIENLGTAMEHEFRRAERLEASIGEVIAGSEGYIIWQDERLIETAQNYDEATRKGKVVKRRHPEAKVEIQYSGVTVETEVASFSRRPKEISSDSGTGVSFSIDFSRRTEPTAVPIEAMRCNAPAWPQCFEDNPS